MYHRRAVDIERDRVECTIVGPNNPSDQSVSPDNFLHQIMSVLKANNFAIIGTEAISGDCYLATIQTLLQVFLYPSGLGFCDYDATVVENRGTFQWNETEVNRTASTLCTYGPAGQTATRLCAVRDTWAVPSVDKCGTVVSEQFTMIQKVMSKLDTG